MLEGFTRPLAAYWASTFPDTAPLVARAVGAAHTTPLWSGPALTGSDLVNGLMSVLSCGISLTLLFLAVNLFGFYAVCRSRNGRAITMRGTLPLFATAIAYGVLILTMASAYSRIDKGSRQAAAITEEAIYLASTSNVIAIKPREIRSVSFCNDCNSVTFHLITGGSLTIAASTGELESLRSAANAIMGIQGS